MRNWQWADRVEGNIICFFITQNLVASVEHLVQLSDPIFIAIIVNVALKDFNLLHRRVVRLRVVWLFTRRESSHTFRCIGQCIASRKAINNIFIKAHSNQVTTGNHAPMRHEWRLLNSAASFGDQEFFRRDIGNINLARVFDLLNHNVVNTIHCRCASFIKNWIAHRIKDRVRYCVLFNYFNALILKQHCQFIIRQTFIGFLGNIFLIFPNSFNNSVLLQQSIKEPVMQNHHARIVFQEDVIQVISSLLCTSFIAWANRISNNNLVRTSKDADQRR